MIREAVSFADIIQDGIEDNQEFFIKINLLFPVDRMGINRAVLLMMALVVAMVFDQ